MTAQKFLFTAAAVVAGLWAYDNFGPMLPNAGGVVSK
jgi:hypothetical protein